MKNRILLIIILIGLSGCYSDESVPRNSVNQESKLSKLQYWVTSDRLERRTCPSEDCGSFGQLFFRDGVQIEEIKGQWSRISRYYNASCKDGKSVYVKSGNANCLESNGIQESQLSEWVLTSNLSDTRPADPARGDSGDFLLVKNSDDYKQYKSVFVKAARDLLNGGTCTESDFRDIGGWLKTTLEYRDRPIYFTYCGGVHVSNKIYLNVQTGEIYREYLQK